VEAGSNTSTVALRVVGGDEEGTYCLGDVNTGTWSSRLGESRILSSEIWSRIPQESDLGMTALRGPAAIVNDGLILSSERMLHKDYDHKCSAGEKNADRESQVACRQDKLIGGKPPVVK
jgi:hypothetical protein